MLIFAVQKGADFTLAISGVTEPILVSLAYNVATILPFNIFESEQQYTATHFGMPASRMKVILPILPKIGCHGNVP